MPSRHWTSYLIVLAFSPAVLACGPDFRSVLEDREAHLLSPIRIRFADQQGLLRSEPAVQFRVGGDNDSAAERAGLSLDQIGLLRRARASANGDAAYTLLVALPQDIRLYTAAAVDFHRSLQQRVQAADNCGGNAADNFVINQSIVRFNAVLALPARYSARATWAAYSLGRAYTYLGKFDAAAAAFQRTRRLAGQGMPDPLGLAMASYGEEGRLALCRKDYAKAAQFYLNQAAQGSQSGMNSLLAMAQLLFALPDSELRAQLRHEPVVRLLLAYAADRGGKIDADNEYGMSAHDKPPLRPVRRLLQLAETAQSGRLSLSDQFALLAYNRGRYELAGRLSTGDTPLAHWVQGKLALRAGDLEQAAQQYAMAAQAFPLTTKTDEDAPADRLRTESGLLDLARGEYLNAFGTLYALADKHWLDVAHVAERVLTLDELKDFVDRQVPASAPRKNWVYGNPPAQLRDLLARRLMRAGRHDEAQAYFHADEDRSFSSSLRARAAAARYAQTLSDASEAADDEARARALFRAATLTRRHGLAILGYELNPDQYSEGGNYMLPDVSNKLSRFKGAEEVARVEESGPKPDRRFHYRHVASRLATETANLLPTKSQAYAACLCWAAAWVMERDFKEARRLYKLYRQTGRFFIWADRFGQRCPEPDFTGAFRQSTVTGINFSKRP